MTMKHIFLMSALFLFGATLSAQSDAPQASKSKTEATQTADADQDDAVKSSCADKKADAKSSTSSPKSQATPSGSSPTSMGHNVQQDGDDEVAGGRVDGDVPRGVEDGLSGGAVAVVDVAVVGAGRPRALGEGNRGGGVGGGGALLLHGWDGVLVGGFSGEWFFGCGELRVGELCRNERRTKSECVTVKVGSWHENSTIHKSSKL